MGKNQVSLGIDLLPRVEKIFAAHRDFRGTAHAVYRLLARVSGIRNFSVVLCQAGERHFDLVLSVENGKAKSPGSKNLMTGLLQYVVDRRRPLMLNRGIGRFLPRFKGQTESPRRLPKSWLGVPMISASKVEGIIHIQDFEKENRFSISDERFLTALCSRFADFLENERLRAVQADLMLINPLTRIASRRYLDLIMEREITRAEKFSRSLSLAMIRPAGIGRLGPKLRDRLLLSLGQLIADDIRDTDFFAHYSEKVFMLVLPETNHDGAVTVAERIRLAVEKEYKRGRAADRRRLGIVIGIATYPYHAETLQQLIEIATRALTRSAKFGKHQTD
jgi:diguanylate cyclase (GGDEF)-like protein